MTIRALGVLVAIFCVGPVGSAWAATTVVSLGFDDGDATQYQVRSMLSAHGMHGTFFLNSPRIGSGSYYMTWPQVNDLYADGNEIGGHTTYHSDLTKLDPSEAQRQICYDRVNLLNRGFAVSDFAYPYGAYNASVQQMVASCGYNSARTVTAFGTTCAPLCAEPIPPTDAYATRIVGSGTQTLSQLESEVTNAETHGGGWVQFLFHNICDGCSSNATSPSKLSAFLDWLQPRAANGTVVETVQQVIGGPVQPAVAGPALPPAPDGSNAIRNPSLEQDANGDGVPDCFVTDFWGSQSPTWTRTTDAHTGTYAERVDVSQYSSGDDKLLTLMDLGYCTPTVTPGHQYKVTTWYKSSVPVSFKAFSRDSTWTFAFWTSSASFAAASTWTQATWVTPVIPAGVNGLQFGLAITGAGSLTVDDIAFDDAAPSGSSGDTTPPTSTISCNGAACQAGYYGASVAVSLSATDEPGGSGVDRIVYTLDGTDPSLTNGTTYATPFTVATTTQVKFRAYDKAGNAEPINRQTIQIDTAAPTVSITSPAGGATVTGRVTITANAADTGGSGVASVSFYLDGKLLGTDAGSPYSWSWNTRPAKKGAHTLTAVAQDNAGNKTTSSPIAVNVT